ncbi:hypothetical protein CLSA_c16550 [Clostridium saccharobutylicum DSM 13864]|uniref:Uncharacterized protein n=1 Tax=Clostridium saccharobutylicum DSM 13864 TaxID=1345695 RepID=U5MQ55_CLOSA|nr:hypothetical protein CLSA_c16550 [Clostridium saccharobutylicum DSM 13864]
MFLILGKSILISFNYAPSSNLERDYFNLSINFIVSSLSK